MEFLDLEGDGVLFWFPILIFGYIACIYNPFQYEMAEQSSLAGFLLWL